MLTSERPDERERDAGAGRLQPQLDALLQEQQADRHERGGQQQEAPVELLVRDLQPARSRALARRVDDLVRDLAIALAVELEVLAAAGVRNRRERRAIERRRGSAVPAATCRPACAAARE